ncbi:MAG: hydrogenase nickel incorporation protein HypB [Eubacterium sp.]|nr:hydrogenase nickel incorporation protein HypB [Eubacterium sp.]
MAEDIRIIEVKQSIFADNNADADRLREELKREGTVLINLMSSPGAGKTTLLKQLAKEFAGEIRFAVMEADIDSDVDARAMQDTGVDTIQIHTGGMCHLDADMTRQGLRELGSEKYDLVILENVGNLVCPAEFDTGATANITILSVPEGDDKPLKYPLMYETCQLLIVNKMDVLPYFDFDCEKLKAYAKKRNPDIDILFVSAKTGEGVPEAAAWIRRQIKQRTSIF